MHKRLLATFAFALAAVLSPAPFQAQQPATAQQVAVGQWQNGPVLPYFPVHAQLLRTGMVMIWPGDGGVSGNDPRMLDPASGNVTSLTQPGFDIFCSGHSILPDGRIFVTGGHISNNVGLAGTTIYDPLANTWTKQQNTNAGRWYPTDQVLPNGDVLTLSGDTDLTVGEDTLPQVWQASNGQWRSLSNAQLALGLYPTLSLAPNGEVFNSGPSVTTRYLDTSGTGAWSVVGNHIFQGVRDYDAMVMYRPGKILVIGGSDPATNTAEVIDLTAPVPAWRSTASLAYARRQLNATMLPDGKVLVTGGTGGPGFSNPDPNLAVYAAEEWDPATEQWTTLSNATVPRLYHSIAMLLPDGRVLSTGGNDYLQTEYFSPPYLFAGPRPTITSAPTNVLNGQRIFVGTPDAANITQVSWVRMPSITHTLGMSQAFFTSSALTQATGGISITTPNDPTMPPGFYMLFLLNGSGVPSVAATVHLGPTAANNPLATLTSLSPSSVPNGSSPFALTVSGSNFSTNSLAEVNGTAIATTYISPTQISAVVPASYLLNPGNLQVNVFTPAPGGGNTSPLSFTVTQATTPNLTQTGTIIARITAPIGLGNHNLEVIRDGDIPSVGTIDSRRQYDTYSGGAPATDDWIGYQYPSQQTFAQVIFQEGKNFPDGGFFNNLNVQVRQNGTWVNVQNLVSSPAYPPNDNINFESYTLNFSTITGDAIRIDGAPGGGAYFISVGELQVFGPSNVRPAGSLASTSPASAVAGDPPTRLALTGTNFSPTSIVQWNGATIPSTFVSATQLTATIPAANLASAGSAQLTVADSSQPGNASAPVTFTVQPASAPNLTQTGTIIARVLAPTGGGNHNPEVIRDGDLPPVGSNDSFRQFDTYSGGAPATDDWIGYQYATQQTFAKVIFQEGKNFVDGGWFNNLTVQVRQSGVWTTVQGLTVNPAYPPNDGVSFESYTFNFPAVTGDAIRIDGAPGGSAYFTSIGELWVYGPATSAGVLSTLSPSSATAGDPPLRISITGSGFDASSVALWNGNQLATQYVSTTSITALVPASCLAVSGTAQVTVTTTASGTSAPLTFTINPAPTPNLTQTGTIIASVPNATGGGNHNLGVIRDGDMPAVGTNASQRQYDSWNGGGVSTDAWIGYQYSTPQNFTKVVFQEGMNFVDGGWFNTLTVQVRQNGTWVNVTNLSVTPTYPPNDNVNFETYTLNFSTTTGDAIRIDGQPGGSAYFISVGELQVFGQ